MSVAAGNAFAGLTRRRVVDHCRMQATLCR